MTRLKIAGPQETVVLYREGQGEKAVWKIKAPVETAADQPEVKSLLFALEDLKARDFIDDPKERSAKRAALGKPLATITLHEGETDRTVALFLDPRDNTTAYAESTAREPLYQIARTAAKDLAKGLFDLRAKQLIAAEPDQVKTLVIKTGGKEYALSREGQADVERDGGRLVGVNRLHQLGHHAARPRPLADGLEALLVDRDDDRR